MANENKMGYLPIKKLILQMSLPPMCSMFLQYSYNLVDSMFVANINENALAAVSLSFPITTLMISLSIWIGVGINVLIAGYLGEKEQDLADCATTLGLLVALIVGICIRLCFYAGSKHGTYRHPKGLSGYWKYDHSYVVSDRRSYL